MLTTIQIAGLQTFGYHGLFEEERSLGQKFTFDIEATLNPAHTHRDDQLDASIRYDAMVDAAVSLASGMKYQTLEALGEAVAIGLLRRFVLIETITVGVSKFSPPIPHTLSKVGIAVRVARSGSPAGRPRPRSRALSPTARARRSRPRAASSRGPAAGRA